MEKECYSCSKIKEVYATNRWGTICKECHRIDHPLRIKLWHEIDMLIDENDCYMSGELLDKVFIMMGINPYLAKEIL